MKTDFTPDISAQAADALAEAQPVVRVFDETPASKCRGCGHPLGRMFVDLGYSPLANSYLKPAQLGSAEKHYPLRVFVCEKCLLVQLEEFESPDAIFSDYAYFSSFSTTWVEHARKYAGMMIERFGFGPQHHVVEIASNDGYLLQWFKEQGIPVLGVEPAANVAKVAWEMRGIPSLVAFFGTQTAANMVAGGQSADLLIGNNVLAHVPNVHDFVAGMKLVLKPRGIVTMEFPHLQDLMDESQFDTIYHEHFSYFSLHSVQRIFANHGLVLFDVEELPTHGGSLRIYARHADADQPAVSQRVGDLLAKEKRGRLDTLEAYTSFSEKVRTIKLDLLEFLVDARRAGKRVVGYGAPAKGNTLLNYCGVGHDFIEYTVDRSPYKQGMFLPGSHLPIHHPDKLRETRPDYVIILPWNLKEEIMQQVGFIREWGGRFVVPIPRLTVLD